MTEPASRDRERTRAAILEAAARMMGEKGAGVSLAAIAAHAGVSKGALTHHFPSRGTLEAALVADVLQKVWDEVRSHLEPDAERRGALLRAYIRAMAEPGPFPEEISSPMELMTVLGRNPESMRHVEEDARSWREAFAADGLDPGLTQVLRLAADGLAANHDSPYLTEEERLLARDRLLELARPDPAGAGPTR